MTANKPQLTTETYQRLILEGIQGLPAEPLAEIASFVYLMRKRVLDPQAFDEELLNALHGLELRQLDRDEEAHLEEEFENYEHLYPAE